MSASSNEPSASDFISESEKGRIHIPLWRLGWYFFWIALTTVQGAAGHLRRQVVHYRKLITE